MNWALSNKVIAGLALVAALGGCDGDDGKTPISTLSPTPTATAQTPAVSPTPSAPTAAVRTPTVPPTLTRTPEFTASATWTPTPTRPGATPTNSATASPEPSPTLPTTPTPTIVLPTFTPSPTHSAPPTPTLTATPTPLGSPRPTLPTSSSGWYVGVAKRNITPDSSVFLGGYGLGPSRRSTGVLAPIFVRAWVLSDGHTTVAFAANETQGTFAAYKRGPFGLTETRLAVQQATSGAIPATHIVINSDHSHAGPDTTGVWGGLPNSYMEFLHEQTVGAIVDAWNAMEPVDLYVGRADATPLLRSQFDQPPNDRVDGDLRVVVATAPNRQETIRAVLVNFAAHATVMGASNTLISADWPGVVADTLEGELGLRGAVVMVADVGRTQPADRGDLPDPERLQEYAGRVLERTQAALAALEPLSGSGIAAEHRFLHEPFANPLVEFSLLAQLISRSALPPWLEGEIIGTFTSVVRVGDVVFSAMPGEGYPAIRFELRDRIPAQEHFVFGLANDQLGYLIAPEEGYEQVRAAAPQNDNAIFNASPSIGDHVMCSLFAAADSLGLRGTGAPTRCSRWAGEDARLPF